MALAQGSEVKKGRGGRRDGAGRKRGAVVSPPAATRAMPAELPPGMGVAGIEYTDARAAHEYWKAQLAEQEFKKRAGELVPTAEVEQAAATLFATIAQTIRGWPDNLERLAGLTAEQAEALEKMVDGLCLTIQGKVAAFGRGAE